MLDPKLISKYNLQSKPVGLSVMISLDLFTYQETESKLIITLHSFGKQYSTEIPWNEVTDDSVGRAINELTSNN